MTIIMLVLICVYCIGVIVSTNDYLKAAELSDDNELAEVRQHYQKLLSKKDILYSEKLGVEGEAVKIFTLYDITRETTRNFQEEEAFKVFEKKLTEHVECEECLFYDALAPEIEDFRKNEEYFIFTFQGKRKKAGYLVIKGLGRDDQEKVMIMGHQFALTLRRIKLYNEIERIAITDSLTGVYTRRYCMERFEEELERSKLRKIKLAILMVDVDFFKKYNDNFGHLTGDRILREIGVIISQNIREIDIAGRYGGEEFFVVLPDTDLDGAQYAAERIRQATEAASIKAYDTKVKATVSIGVATYPESGKTTGELIDKADWALYRSKKLGRNKVSSFGVYDEDKQ